MKRSGFLFSLVTLGSILVACSGGSNQVATATVDIQETVTRTILPKSSQTPEPTPTVVSSPTIEPAGNRYGAMVVSLMRSVNAREAAIGSQQTNWGLPGTPDGGQEHPALDALDGIVDLTPYIKGLQFAIPNLFRRPDDPNGSAYVFWDEANETPYSGFAAVYGYSWWQSDPSQGNLEEMRQVLEEMKVIGIYNKTQGIGLQKFASDTSVLLMGPPWNELTFPAASRGSWKLDELQFAMHASIPKRDPTAYLSASKILGTAPPNASLTRVFLSFDTSYLANAPAIVGEPKLYVRHTRVVAQENWMDNPNDPIRAASFGIGLGAGWTNRTSGEGTGYSVTLANWNISADAIQDGWDSCSGNVETITVNTVGIQNGIDIFWVDRESIYTSGLTEFRIALRDETNISDPGFANSMYYIYAISGSPLDHLLVVELNFDALAGPFVDRVIYDVRE